MFPLILCDVKIGSNKQVLTGTPPLNQTFESSFHTLYFYTTNDGKRDATRPLGALLKILVFNMSMKEKLGTYKDILHPCSGSRIHIPVLLVIIKIISTTLLKMH
jgi:hypothetical protein